MPLITGYSPAVVPIFVNAGAAAMPALIAAGVSIAGLLLRPRELLIAVQRKPWRVLASLAMVLLAVGGFTAWATAPAPPRATTPPTSASVDWAAVAQNLLRARVNPQVILSPLWHHPLNDEMALASPALHHAPGGRSTLYVPGMVYTTQQQYGTFWAFDASSGALIWRTTRAAPIDGSSAGELLLPIFSTPAIAAGGMRVIIGQGLHDSVNCSMVCFDVPASLAARSGRAAWTVPTPLHLESTARIFTRDGEECAVIGAGAIEGPDRLPIGHPGYLLCVSVATGQELWRYQLNDPEAAVAIDDRGIVYAGAGVNGNAVVALRSEPDAQLAGIPRLIWRVPTPFPATGDLTLARHPQTGAGLVLLGIGNGDYVNADPNPAGSVLALDSDSGRQIWQHPLPDGVLARLTVQGRQVLAACRDGWVYALDLAGGDVLWKTRVSPTPAMPVLSGVASDGRYAFAIAADGTLAVLSLEDGTLLESRRLFDPVRFTQNLTMATPLAAGGKLFVCTETAGVHVFRIAW